MKVFGNPSLVLEKPRKAGPFTKISGQIPGKQEVSIVTYKAFLVPRETCRQRGRKTEGQKQGLQNPLRLPGRMYGFSRPWQENYSLIEARRE